MKLRLSEFQEELTKRFQTLERTPELKPEKIETSHCTIRFLANVEKSKIALLETAVRNEFEKWNFRPFDITLGSCGVFPNRNRANVLWIGLTPEKPFQDLFQAISNALVSIGLSGESDHPFHPHLTLFRFRSPFAIPQTFELPDLHSKSSIELISEVELLDSKTLPQGPIHTTLARFPF